jgi:hypothetical protein
MIKRIAAVVVVLSSSFAFAGPGNAKYELQRIPMGPRPDQYVLVRVDRATRGDRPYALTGDTQERRAARPAARLTPSHAKGTHGQF